MILQIVDGRVVASGEKRLPGRFETGKYGKIRDTPDRRCPAERPWREARKSILKSGTYNN